MTARRRRWRWVLALAAAVAVPVALLAGYRAFLERAATARLRALQAAGWPTTPAELLAAYPPIESGPNAALLYIEAFGCLKEGDDEEFQGIFADLPLAGDGKLPPAGEPLPRAAREAIEAYLRANQGALRLLHQAAAVRPSRYPLEPDEEGSIRLDYVYDLLRAVRLLDLEMAYRTDAGEAQATVESAVASLALGRSLRSEPLTMPQTFAVAIDSISLEALERSLTRLELADAQLVELDGALAERDDFGAWRHALIGQRALLGVWFREVVADDRNFSLGLPGLAFIYDASGAKKRDFLESMRMFERSIAICELPEAERYPALRQLEEQIAEAGRESVVRPTISPHNSSVRALFGGLRAAAGARAARAALAVERFRLARGRLPGALAELVPGYLEALPADPFAAAPLRYKVLERGFVVYSLGPDAGDGGGAVEPGDVTFTVGR